MSPSRGQRAAQGTASTPFLSDADLQVWLGDAVESLQQLPDDSVQMCVTSPPFYGLRDYGTGTWTGGEPECDHLAPMRSSAGDGLAAWSAVNARGGGHVAGTAKRQQYGKECGKCGAVRVDAQIGLEATVGEWVAALVEVFREVRRVMRPDGTLWLELGDSYCAGDRGRYAGDGARPQTNQATVGSYPVRPVLEHVKPKDLIGGPFEVVFALRADGWWWRQTIIWEKRNAMPESAKDRPTTAHSYVFLLTPSARYFYDDEAIAEPAEWVRWGSQDAGKYEAVGKGAMVQPLSKEQIDRKFGGGRQRGSGKGGYKTTGERNERFQGSAFDLDVPQERLGGWHDHSADLEQGNGKQTTSDGTPAGTVRSEGWQEQVDAGGGLTRRSRSVWSLATEPNRLAVCSVCEAFWDGDHPDQHCGQPVVEHFAAFPRELARRAILAGSREGDVVLDPFGGSGTTAMAARELGRKAVLVELRREYAVMIRERTRQQSLLGIA